VAEGPAAAVPGHCHGGTQQVWGRR
jgi:hypothetical protein